MLISYFPVKLSPLARFGYYLSASLELIFIARLKSAGLIPKALSRSSSGSSKLLLRWLIFFSLRLILSTRLIIPLKLSFSSTIRRLLLTLLSRSFFFQNDYAENYLYLGNNTDKELFTIREFRYIYLLSPAKSVPSDRTTSPPGSKTRTRDQSLNSSGT
ncbi:hypothetical protein F8M41_001464 [Gigaspora margarita]|uniref:Uncharacterized protein n=1 Tax=Gigaspora margarita TaxID=4874 RepID=A0A8H3XEG3_GIGMA|nr:hypothetical protein F8M41_001464 [Gigaspora margarita]